MLVGVSHETRIHNIALESVIIMIGVSHETRNHIALESVIIIIGVLLGEKSNGKTTQCLSIFMIHMTLANFVIEK